MAGNVIPVADAFCPELLLGFLSDTGDVQKSVCQHNVMMIQRLMVCRQISMILQGCPCRETAVLSSGCRAAVSTGSQYWKISFDGPIDSP
jgi:hypothetical protein